VTWVRLIEFAVALILVPAALSKAVDVKGFTLAVRRFEILPSSLSRAVALGTIGAEIALALLLITGLAQVQALVVATLLFAAFSAIAWVEVSRREADEPVAECGCLGGVLRLRMSRGSATLNLFVSCLCVGAAMAVASGAGGDALSLSEASLALLAVPLACTYWLTHYALSVIATMEISMHRAGEIP
jgi:hypothetical protein